jgi:hypothetical protein
MADVDTERELARQSKRRDLQERLTRVSGEIDASARGAAAMARVNEDARRIRDALQTELNALGSPANPLDSYGRYSALDRSLDTEREFVKAHAYAWLVQNPMTIRTAMVARMEELAVDYAATKSPSRRWVLLRYESVLAEWIANAAEARRCGLNWEAFRDYILALGRDGALGLR